MRVVTLRACIASAALGATARAAPATFVALDYQIAPDTAACPGADEFRASIRRQLGYNPFRSSAERRVAVRIVQRGTGFDGRIRWRDAHGRWVGDRLQSSQSPDCSEIAASLAFSVAVQVQLLAALAPAAPDSAATPTPAADATAPAPTKDLRTPRPTSTPIAWPREEAAPGASGQGEASGASRLTLSLGLGPSAALGLAPHPTAVGRIFASGRLAQLSLELAGDAALPVTQNEADASAFSIERLAGAAAACGHAQAFAACLTATVGRLQARGSGLDQPESPAGTFWQVGGRVSATHDFSDRYFASVRADGLVMLSSWTVTLNGAAVWTTPRVAAVLGMDFGVRFF